MKVKYLHILWYNDLKFYPNFVKMINESGNFNPQDFLFITPFKEVYEVLKKYDNVKIVEDNINLKKIKYQYDWLFLHPNSMTKLQTILLPKRVCKKIIWRTWGHDIRPLDTKNEKGFIKKVLKKILFWLYVRKVNQFRAIAIANDIDKVNVQNVFGKKINLFILNYGYRSENFIELSEIQQMKEKDNNIRILIGHNAAKAENHIENLYRLEKYAKENITLVLPLSYSIQDKEYIEHIKNTSIKLFTKDKVEFIENFMPKIDYAKLISNIDIAIMDQEFSNGLGNLSLLIYFKKKIYVNRNGNIAQSFRNNGIAPNYTDEIGKIPFRKFADNTFDKKMNMYIENSTFVDKDASIKKFINIIESLK